MRILDKQNTSSTIKYLAYNKKLYLYLDYCRRFLGSRAIDPTLQVRSTKSVLANRLAVRFALCMFSTIPASMIKSIAFAPLGQRCLAIAQRATKGNQTDVLAATIMAATMHGQNRWVAWDASIRR